MHGRQETRQLWDLWNYYRAAAEISGRKKSDSRKEEQKQDEKQEQGNYSLLWFFESTTPEELCPIARAFLGDSAAMQKLNCGAAAAEGWEKFLLEGRKLDDSQREAIRSALAAPVSFIQGPPGTGKTETILNLASCAARLGKGHSVAIVSSNNAALADIKAKIDQYDESGPNKRWLKQHFARLGNKDIREKEFKDSREELPVFQFKSHSVEVSRLKVTREKDIQAKEFLRKYPIISSTIHSLINCFQDGMTYRYDYVIMDESSQTAPVAGLVAMSCARHLILVGDQKQLPPIIKEEYPLWDIPEAHVIKPDRSFLDACLDVFQERAVKTVLRNHYRCHPGIIQFCLDEVYREEKLEICTDKSKYDHSVQTPIKILWFKGNYCERDTGKGSRNRKQIACFMEEEWPDLLKRLQEEKPPSVCILSPFRRQLKELKDAIEESQSTLKLSIQSEDGSAQDQDDQDNQNEDFQEIPMLTIHKSQGKEFDVVYLLPVEDTDNWEWPWSQQKRLINVAVSRAKKELRVILSQMLMEKAIQRDLDRAFSKPTENEPEEHKTEEQEAESSKAKDELYLQKLVRYVKEKNEKLERRTGTKGYPISEYEYGFHRSKRSSIFDEKPIVRQKAAPKGLDRTDEAKEKEGPSAPELCMTKALLKLMDRYPEEQKKELSLYTNVCLKDLSDKDGAPLTAPEDDPEINRIIEHGHFDFVLCRGERIILVVEVDGGYHRKPDGEQKTSDDAKDRLVRRLGGVCYAGNLRKDSGEETKGSFAFLRLPDDGSTCLETQALWQQADKELQDKYFTIEKLIEPYLDGPNGGMYTVPTRTISEILKTWDGTAEKKRGARWANQLLERKGLLRREFYRLPDQRSVVPTKAGEAFGIVTAFRFSEGKFYRNAVYTKRAQDWAFEYLLDI